MHKYDDLKLWAIYGSKISEFQIVTSIYKYAKHVPFFVFKAWPSRYEQYTNELKIIILSQTSIHVLYSIRHASVILSVGIYL